MQQGPICPDLSCKLPQPAPFLFMPHRLLKPSRPQAACLTPAEKAFLTARQLLQLPQIISCANGCKPSELVHCHSRLLQAQQTSLNRLQIPQRGS